MIYTIDQLRAITVPIAASYGVRRLSLFGSYARGEATETSDIDLLVDRGNMPGGWAIGGLYADLREALGKELDMVTTSFRFCWPSDSIIRKSGVEMVNRQATFSFFRGRIRQMPVPPAGSGRGVPPRPGRQGARPCCPRVLQCTTPRSRTGSG